MSFIRPSRADLVARSEADVATRLGLGALISRSILKGFAAVVAGLSHGLHGHADYLSRQYLPDTADSANLERWGSIFGVQRKAATFATGGIVFTGVDGSNIPIQTVVQRADGERYETLAAVTIAGGVGNVQVQALAAGDLGNAAASSALTLSNPVAGVDTTALVASGGLTAGADLENDAGLLGRILTRLQNPPQGGSAADYILWSLEVAGVTRAWALPGHLGPGTVGVTFVEDGKTSSIIPAAPKVAEVAAYIETLRPVTALVSVFAPGELATAMTIAVSPDNADVRLAVEASLEEMLRREAAPGQTLPLSKLSEAISSAQGETSHVLSVPSSDVTPAAGEIITLGAITWV